MIFIIEYIIIIIIIYSNRIVTANDRTMGGSWYGDTVIRRQRRHLRVKILCGAKRESSSGEI